MIEAQPGLRTRRRSLLRGSDGKVALVTGANKGIGKEIARGLAEAGYLVLVGCRDSGLGERAVQELQNSGRGALLVIDVTDAVSVQQAAEHVSERFGALDVLVNNAGVGLTDGLEPDPKSVALTGIPLPSQTATKYFRSVFEVNVFGVVEVTNAFLPLLAKSPAGRIVNISSKSGSFGSPAGPASPLYSPYKASKTALNAITSHYAKEFEMTGSIIKINAVCPGYCKTDFNWHRGTNPPEQGAQIAIKMAQIAADGPNGGFFNDGGPLSW